MSTTPSFRKTATCALTAIAALTAGLRAQDAARLGSPVPMLRSGEYNFSILPKSFQKKPTLEMTFDTELTSFGRLLRPASPADPVYYVAQAAGYRAMGWGTQEKVPRAADLERVMNRALADNGYLPATPEHPASLALFYFWGSHYRLPPGYETKFPELQRQYRLEREALVGGKKFMDYMEYGFGTPRMVEHSDYLQYQARDDLYFAVVAAFDYSSLAKGQKKMAWATHLTVNAGGLALTETVAPLIASGAQFFGRETAGPEIGSRRISREGRVEIGTATVVDEKEPTSGADGKKPDGK